MKRNSLYLSYIHTHENTIVDKKEESCSIDQREFSEFIGIREAIEYG